MFGVPNTVVWSQLAFPLADRCGMQNSAKDAPAEIARKCLIEIVIGKKIFRRGFERTFELL